MNTVIRRRNKAEFNRLKDPNERDATYEEGCGQRNVVRASS